MWMIIVSVPIPGLDHDVWRRISAGVTRAVAMENASPSREVSSVCATKGTHQRTVRKTSMSVR